MFEVKCSNVQVGWKENVFPSEKNIENYKLIINGRQMNDFWMEIVGFRKGAGSIKS